MEAKKQESRQREQSHESLEERVMGLSELTLDAELEPRVKLDESMVSNYAEQMVQRASDKSVVDRQRIPFPALRAFFDGEVYWLADGFHRVAAAKHAGIAHFQVVIEPGDRRDALAYSLGANARDGKRRTNADKRRAIKRAFADPAWAAWSDARIARLCGVSTPTVGKVRRQLEADGELEAQEMRRGADGRLYPRASEQRAMAGRASVRVRRKKGTVSEAPRRGRRARSHREMLARARTVPSIDLLEQDSEQWIDVLFAADVEQDEWSTLADRARALVREDGLVIVPNTIDLPTGMNALRDGGLEYLGCTFIDRKRRTYHLFGNRRRDVPSNCRNLGALLKACHPSQDTLILIDEA